MKNENEKPLAQRITQGKVKHWIGQRGAPGEECESAYVETTHGKHIAKVFAIPRLMPRQIADASLIVEAFNVTCETGKTPAQLAAENARLRAALKKIVDMESQTHIPSGQRFWTATTIADDALRVSPSSPAVAGPAEIPSL